MPASRPFPKTLIRDLQGLVRLVYRAEQAVDMPESYGRLGRLEEAGRALADACELAKKGQLSTAWYWVDKGVAILKEQVAGEPELENLVRVAALAMRRR